MYEVLDNATIKPEVLPYFSMQTWVCLEKERTHNVVKEK